MFTEYRIQSNANNEITLLLSSEALLAALKSASASAAAARPDAEPGAQGVVEEPEEIVMKLAKKDGQAVLSFEIFGATRMGRKVRVGHDVRVEVLKPGDVERLEEPMCPEPDVRHSYTLSTI